MSLINQMLKDLEQRGAGSTDAEKIITTSLNAAVMTPYPNRLATTKHGVPLLKISGLMVLLVGGTYLWVQSTPALSHSIDHLREMPIATESQVVMVNAISNSASKKVEAAYPATSSRESSAFSESNSLFENSLKYTPIAAQTQTNKPDKNIVVANVMPAELAYESISTKPTESAKPIATIEPINNQIEPERFAATPKSLAHSVSNNTSISKQISPDQKSGNFYRQALANLQQGRVAEAQSNLAQALEASPANQEARQTLAGLLLDNNRSDEARTILAAGLAIAPEQSNFRMALARLQVEVGDKSGALNTLEQGLAYANNNAEYQSFLATMLQRANRHEEAISHYNTSLSLNSGAANPLIGLGISLQAVGRLENAQQAFTRAQSITTLSPELSQFIDQQLKQINQHLQN